ncbi:hypothetical protein IMSAGC013_02421 [Lachnospiraceae bacterium]|nr:hypothetical protein IMSAGC013_02421 [Lachnospiraceae bacterium]
MYEYTVEKSQLKKYNDDAYLALRKCKNFLNSKITFLARGINLRKIPNCYIQTVKLQSKKSS